MTQTQAMLCALAAFFGWVFMDTAIKLAGQHALSPFMIMTLFGVTGAAAIVAITFVKKRPRRLRPSHLRQQLLVSLCATVNYYAIAIALKHLSLTLFYIVVFTAPLMIAALSAFLKHEVLTRTKLVCLLTGFLGVVVAVGLQGTSGTQWIGCLAALGAVAGFSIYTVTIRKISHTDTPESIQLMTSLAIGTTGLIGSHFSGFPDGPIFAMLVGAGLLNLLCNFLYNKALHGTSSTNVAQLHYTQIISGALIGYLIWHEVPTWNLIVGSLIIVASGIVVAHQAHKADS